MKEMTKKLFILILIWLGPLIILYFIIGFVTWQWNATTWSIFNTTIASKDNLLGRLLLLLGCGLCLFISTIIHEKKF